jgi:phosphoribosylamine--glycine ligase / phosphoribosylformylglycinamidine cyclo-ligase
MMQGSRLDVLLVGSGGREHALAWKIAQSPRLGRLFIAPGNAGTRQLGENVPVFASDISSLVEFAKANAIDLVISGPEAPLAAGLADALQTAGIKTFGPSRAAARIEASKAYAKDFMLRHSIPTARYAVFVRYTQAMDYLRKVDHPVVIKASGLAAGKGVVVPETQAEAEDLLQVMLVQAEFGEASRQVIIEERLNGPEVSLLAFCDGRTVQAMPPVQDYKRLLDGDLGPNTGGMGAYAPAPICPPAMVSQIVRTILQPAVDGLRLEGSPFCGVLFAGLILTTQGPKVLEFNCRFGDPSAQALLPLLDGDLLEVAEACVQEQLEAAEIRWKPQSAACVVLAQENYPRVSASGSAAAGKAAVGITIEGLDEPDPPQALVFHAGTRLQGEQVVASGGRVLAVTGLGATLPQAVQAVYERVDTLAFHGMQYRQDIGQRGLADLKRLGDDSLPERRAADGNKVESLMRQVARTTFGPEVLDGIGVFGGLFDAAALKDIDEPVLVASTSGVRNKVRLAAQARRFTAIGHDIVNHCLNDILVQGARPLFFLDYLAASSLEAGIAAQVVSGIAEACREAGCALLGGETAEMPGVYAPDQFDVAGTMVGVVAREHILPRPNLRPGDVLIGLASSGAHTNGYAQIRKAFADVPLDTVYPELGISLGDALLAPHRSYYRQLWPLLQAYDKPIKALAHLTSGGLWGDLPRILPPDLGIQIKRGSWPIPPLFELIQRQGDLSDESMYRVFNMGIGMVVVTAAGRVQAVQAKFNEPSWLIGEIVSGDGRLEWV